MVNRQLTPLTDKSSSPKQSELESSSHRPHFAPTNWAGLCGNCAQLASQLVRFGVHSWACLCHPTLTDFNLTAKRAVSLKPAATIRDKPSTYAASRDTGRHAQPATSEARRFGGGGSRLRQRDHCCGPQGPRRSGHRLGGCHG